MTALLERAAGGRSWLEPASVATIAFLGALLCALAAKWPADIALIVLVIAVVGVLLVRLDLAVLTLVACAPLEMTITQGTGTQFTPTKIAGAICFLSFLFNVVATRRRLVVDWLHAVAGGILAIAAVSTTIATDPALGMSTTMRYASFVALLFIVSQFSGQTQFYRRLAWVLSVASAYTAYKASSNFLSGFTLRADVENGDPNDLAFILATTLPLTVWLLRERGLRRLAVFAMIGLISVGIVLTLSRGALLGLAVGALWAIFIDRRHVRAVLGGVAVATAAVALVVAFNEAPVQRGLNAKQRVATENVDTRYELWTHATNLAVEHPMLGVGPGNFGIRYKAAADAPAGYELNEVVHNAYLDVMVELGIVAGILFVTYLVMCFKRLTRAIRYSLGPPELASATRTALVIGIVAAITLSEQFYAPFWLLGGLAVAISSETRTLAADAT